MKFKSVNAIALGAVAAFSLVSAAGAQTTYGLTGSTAGVCLLSSNALIGSSAVGKAVDARLKQLAAAVSSELTPEKTAIEAEDKAIAAAAKTATTPAQQAPLQQRAQALGLRAQNYQNKATLRENELRATQQKALARIGTEAQPVVRQVATQKACSVVVDTGSVIDANPAMDITSAAVQALDAKISTITFERERLDSQPAASQNR